MIVERAVLVAVLLGVTGLPLAWGQAVPPGVQAPPVQGDAGISSMRVFDEPTFRVLRNYAQPGATRRMHNHPDVAWHVFTVVTGTVRVSVEGEPTKEVHAGEMLHLKGGVMHSFTNTGQVVATLVEVFGKVP